MKKPVPNQNESPFGFHEFFFSTTNKRGVIRFGNDVFVRVSVYPKEQMIGAPHSIIRHPDVPRSVFKIFWDALKSDKAIGAYVKNLAGNGSYYWVFAFAFPIEDGYLSIRFKPSSAIFKVVQDVYAEVRTFEESNDDLESSEQLLVRKIRERGFRDYDDFMVQAVLAELTSRAEHDRDSSNGLSLNQVGAFKQIAETTNATLSQLNDIFGRVRGFQESNKILITTIESLDAGFRNLSFISINMTVAAAKFGNLAVSLGVVSKEFSALSRQIEDNLNGLATFGRNLGEVIQQCTLRISALNSLMLMVDFFVKESVLKSQSSENAFSEMTSNRKDFSQLFHDYATNLKAEVTELDKHLSGIEAAVDETAKFLTGLEVIRQIGAIESARVEEVKHAFLHYLDEMAGFIQLVRQATTDVSHEVQSLKQSSHFIDSAIDTISGNVDKIFDLASTERGSGNT